MCADTQTRAYGFILPAHKPLDKECVPVLGNGDTCGPRCLRDAFILELNKAGGGGGEKRLRVTRESRVFVAVMTESL